jgi:hypothetical protein
MSRDYAPQNDQQFKIWLANFVAMLEMNAGMVGLLPADVTPLAEASDSFAGALDSYVAKLVEVASASGLKKTERTDAVDVLRPLVRRINNHPGMTNQLRGLLGLPQKGEGVRTVATVPQEIPQIYLETEPGTVVVHFGTEPGNERINGKPVGVKGCNIYRKKGEAGEFEMVTFASASPFHDEVFGVGSDYTYYVRYRGTKPSDLGQGSIQAKIAARGLAAA